MKRGLELRVPPPVVLLGFAAVAAGLRWLVPGIGIRFPWAPAVAAGVALIGVGIAVSGVAQVLRAGTTILPHEPSNATRVVSTGVYAFTRNPMYLGLALVLTALAIWLAHPLALLCVPGFVAYLNRFQIVPEERALLAKFGDDYAAYLKSVRRWV